MRKLGGLAAAVLLLGATAAVAQDAAKTTKIDLYGFAMLDMGYDVNQNDPAWFDVMRPTKLPSVDNEFGEDGRFYSGVRQSRLGVKTWTPTKLGELYTVFEFELFGTGVDAGQTTFRLRHAYGELGKMGAGQTWSPFMDIDVFPNSIEYWGPNAMVFFRNVQVRYYFMKGDNEFVVALERPGASGDGGVASDFVTTEGLQGRFPAPDLSGHWRMTRGWGHLQVSGILRYMKIDDPDPVPFDLSDSLVGWGAHVSTNVKFGKDTLRASVVYGEGIQNYMNDAPVDVGPKATGDPTRPIEGEALPLLGLVAFYDHTWSDKWTSSIGYSYLDIDNSDLQAPEAFAKGHYALVNALYYPVENVMFGPELQWGRRENNTDGFSVDDVRIQFSARYKFGHSWGGQ
jgi:hypothetical protein